MADAGDGLAPRPLARAAAITALGILAATLIYAWLAWDRRWIADDGLIVVRAARQILAGNGPVYSAFERAEPTTSTLWLWLVAACGWVTNGNVARLAVAAGGVLAVGGLVIALDATRRFHRGNGHTGVLAPAGALVVLGVFPFWDFATSGLETGLALCWIATIWWLLGALGPDSSRRYLAGFAFVVGLGPLVRPDFAAVTAVFAAAGWLIVRPPWRRALGLAGCAIALPALYELFRAGYYGALVPLPALAKSATSAEWARGFTYLTQFVKPHLLYVPIALLAAAFALDRRTVIPRNAVVLAAPITAAVVLAGFVIRVGGDFMHGRMLLPSTLLVIAPALVLPLRRATAPLMVAVALWAVFVGHRFYDRSRRIYHDERADYERWTHQRNPVDEAAHVGTLAGVMAKVAEAIRDHQPLLIDDAGTQAAMNPGYQVPVIVVAGRLGVGGAIAPLDGIVVDVFGLANPLGARITRTQPGKIGHEKALSWVWVLADFAAPAATLNESPAAIAAARHAMTCGALAELLASVRAPLTPARFWANLTGAMARTRLVIPADPIAAERAFCAPGQSSSP
jgi:arabinofuranosyltransferase